MWLNGAFKGVKIKSPNKKIKKKLFFVSKSRKVFVTIRELPMWSTFSTDNFLLSAADSCHLDADPCPTVTFDAIPDFTFTRTARNTQEEIANLILLS